MVEIESGDVQSMHDETFAELLNEINAKSQRARLSVLLAWGLGFVGLLAAFAIGWPGLAIACLAFPAWAFGRWLDSYRRTAVLFYELDSDTEDKYQALVSSFDELSNCAGKWHIQSGGAIRDLTDWKRNAGATHLVGRSSTTLTFKLPTVVQSNATPPALQVGRQTLYFLPDVVLIEDGRRYGAVSYSDLSISWHVSDFIEAGTVPYDAQVVSYTWQHPNRRGGPDRRFRNNRQIPVCRYETMHLSSATGVNELVEFSRIGLVVNFSRAVRSLPSNITPPPVAPMEAAARSLPSNSAPSPVAPTEPAQTPSENLDELRPSEQVDPPFLAPAKSGTPFGWITFGLIALGIIYLLIKLLHPGSSPPTVPPTTAVPSRPPSAAPPSAAPPERRTSPSSTQQQGAAPSASSPATIQDTRPLTVDEIRELQSRLRALGFDAGFPDGIPGAQTIAAIRRYEASRAFEQTGKADRATLERLRNEK